MSDNDDDFAGVGPFNFDWMGWFKEHAREHDRWFEEVRDGKRPAYDLWRSNRIFFRRVFRHILNLSYRERLQRPVGIISFFLAIFPIYIWTLYRYIGAITGIWRPKK